jgi:hypothetical protein
MKRDDGQVELLQNLHLFLELGGFHPHEGGFLGGGKLVVTENRNSGAVVLGEGWNHRRRGVGNLLAEGQRSDNQEDKGREPQHPRILASEGRMARVGGGG